MGELIDAKKREKEQLAKDAQKIEIYRKLARQLQAIVHLLAQLDLGYKIDLKG